MSFTSFYTPEEFSYSVKMKVNKNTRGFKKGDAIDVVISYYTSGGTAIFKDENNYEIHERHLDVITRENDPEYFL